MSILARISIAAALAVAIVTPAAAIDGFQSGGGFKIYKVQLGIKPPNNPGCPAAATVQGWVYVSHPTKVQIMVAREGQGIVGGPVEIQSKKASNGQYLAQFAQQININTSIDTKYRLLVGGGSGAGSNWVPLKVTC